MKTESFQVYGVNIAIKVASQLIQNARWFQCEEWPPDEFRFVVKHKDAPQIEKRLATGPAGYGISWNWGTKEGM